MKMIKVKKLKRPYVNCDVCTRLWNPYKSYGSDIKASNKLVILNREYSPLWFCDKHLKQFKDEVNTL